MNTSAPTALRRVRRFRKNADGSTIVEFALVAIPFFGLMGMIVETGFGLLASQALESGTAAAARAVMVGEISRTDYKDNNGNTIPKATAFKQIICNEAAWFIPCDGIYYTVQSYSSFGSVGNISTPTKDGTLDTAALNTFNIGAPGSIVVVRSYYKRKVYLDIIKPDAGRLPGGYQLIVGTSVFKNEG